MALPADHFTQMGGETMQKNKDYEGFLTPYCLHCGEKTSFKSPPVERTTGTGHRPYLIGRCSVCNNVVSLFLPGDRSKTKHNVVLSLQHLTLLREVSQRLGIPMRQILEELLEDHLAAYQDERLHELKAAGLLPSNPRPWNPLAALLDWRRSR